MQTTTTEHIAACNLLGACTILHQIACIQSNLKKKKKKKIGSRKVKSAQARTRRLVEEIYLCLGPTYFFRSYQMSYATFLVLHDMVKDGIVHAASDTSQKRNEGRSATSSLGSRAREETSAAKRVLTTNLHRFQMAPLQQLFVWPVLFAILQVVPLTI